MCHCKGWHPLAVFLYSKDLEHLRICLWIPWKTNSKMHLKMAKKEGHCSYSTSFTIHPFFFGPFWTFLLFHFREGIFNSQKVTWIDFVSGVCPSFAIPWGSLDLLCLGDNGCLFLEYFPSYKWTYSEKKVTKFITSDIAKINKRGWII